MSSIKHGLQYAKIIAIVDKNTGELHSYRWSIARENHDYFADPEDRKKYLAVTVKHLQCESISELKAKFEMARDYLKADFLPMLKGTVQGRYNPKQLRYINRVGMMKWERISLVRKIRASPLAHGEEEVYGEEDMRVINNSEMMAMDYKPHDRVLVCESHLNQWLTIVACHETDDDTVIIGRDSKDDELVQFRSKHVLAYRTAKADLSLKMRRLEAMFKKKKLKKEQRNRQ